MRSRPGWPGYLQLIGIAYKPAGPRASPVFLLTEIACQRPQENAGRFNHETHENHERKNMKEFKKVISKAITDYRRIHFRGFRGFRVFRG